MTLPNPYIHTRGDLAYRRTHVWTDGHGSIHGDIDLTHVNLTFHSAAQVRDMIAHLTVLAGEMDDEAGDGDPEDAGPLSGMLAEARRGGFLDAMETAYDLIEDAAGGAA